jgi:hypothetical protein
MNPSPPKAVAACCLCLVLYLAGSGHAASWHGTSGPSRVLAARLDPRQLPSLVVRWTRKGPVDKLVVDRGVAFLRSGAGVAALAAGTGAVLWERDLDRSDDRGDEELLVVDGAVVVASGTTLHLLSRATGLELHAVGIGGYVHRMTGPPLVVAVAHENDSVALLRIDPASGRIVARWQAEAMVYDLAAEQGVVVAITGARDDHAGADALVGLGGDDLRELWRLRLSAFPTFERIRGKLYVQASLPAEEESRFLPIEVRTGKFGSPLPRRAPASGYDSGLPWELQRVDRRGDDSSSRLRRSALTTGKPIWTAELPCQGGVWVRTDGEILFSCGRGGGRDLMVALDWASGRLRRVAYGLREVRQLLAFQDLILALSSDDGVVAFAARGLGPAEAKTRSVEQEARRILAGTRGDESPYGRGDHLRNAIRDLQDLGPGALSAITGELPRLGATALVAAAAVLAGAGYKQAAPALAARLQGHLEEPGASWDSWNPQFAVLAALSRLGGAAEVPIVAGVLNDPSRKGTIRRQALATLASLGTPQAVAALERFLAPVPPQHGVWWSPPSPASFVDLVGQPGLAERARQAAKRGDDRELRRCTQALGAARVARPDGGSLLVFQSDYLGGPGDVWIAPLDGAGKITGPALFSGVSIHRRGRLVAEDQRLAARLLGDTLEVRATRGEGKAAAVSLAEIRRDSDGDGLPDVVERRLRLDPHDPDTDHDGIPDAEDLSPNARQARPQGEEQEIAAAVFRQFFQFEEGRSAREPAIIVSDFALKWSGRQGPTITLGADEDQRFLEEAGYDGIAHIRIRPFKSPAAAPNCDQEPAAADESPSRLMGRPLRGDERAFSLDLYRGGLNAIGYLVVVRRLGGRWVIAVLQVSYVS